jgi:aminoglycoside phosphotransferase (APT) family kinase protein
MQLPFRVPRIVGVLPQGGEPALVERFVEGFPLDLRSGRQDRVKPWEIVGRLAAGVHALPCDVFGATLDGYTTRREHAEACLSTFSGLDEPSVAQAYRWARSHLPPPDPSSFLHGDLLGQNILLGCEEPLGPAITLTLIDWEFASRGDPAHDLAIVTRGTRRPFQIDRGLERLLESYAQAGGSAMTITELRFHELCLAVGWYRDALGGKFETVPPEHYLNQVRAVLRRIQESD